MLKALANRMLEKFPADSPFEVVCRNSVLWLHIMALIPITYVYCQYYKENYFIYQLAVPLILLLFVYQLMFKERLFLTVLLLFFLFAICLLYMILFWELHSAVFKINQGYLHLIAVMAVLYAAIGQLFVFFFYRFGSFLNKHYEGILIMAGFYFSILLVSLKDIKLEYLLINEKFVWLGVSVGAGFAMAKFIVDKSRKEFKK